MLGAPTASGKSAAALELAGRYPLEIVTADAMQVYQGLDVGTAKPTEEERRRVPHHLLDLVRPDQEFSVAQWVRHAEEAIGSVLARGRVPLVVGGTGFYLRALAGGLPTAPQADPSEQGPIWAELEEHGIERLEEELRRTSPQDAERAQRNPRRLVRSLEVLRRTGRPPSAFPLTRPRYRFSLAVLEPSLEELRPRIEARLEQMFESGLVEEVVRLRESHPQVLTARQAIGYKEVERAVAGEISLDEARQALLDATVSYAKRQLTWFRRQPADLRLPMLAAEALPQLERWLEALVVDLRGEA